MSDTFFDNDINVDAIETPSLWKDDTYQGHIFDAKRITHKDGVTESVVLTFKKADSNMKIDKYYTSKHSDVERVTKGRGFLKKDLVALGLNPSGLKLTDVVGMPVVFKVYNSKGYTNVGDVRRDDGSLPTAANYQAPAAAAVASAPVTTGNWG